MKVTLSDDTLKKLQPHRRINRRRPQESFPPKRRTHVPLLETNVEEGQIVDAKDAVGVALCKGGLMRPVDAEGQKTLKSALDEEEKAAKKAEAEAAKALDAALAEKLGDDAPAAKKEKPAKAETKAKE